MLVSLKGIRVASVSGQRGALLVFLLQKTGMLLRELDFSYSIGEALLSTLSLYIYIHLYTHDGNLI